MPVNTSRTDFDEMTPKWKRLRDCFGGRDAVLKSGTAYVPSLPAKDVEQNKDYRERGNFYNATKRTVQGTVGYVFQEAPDVTFPDAISDYLKDITLSNVPFEMFAQDAGNEVMLMARYGVLVDMPATPGTDNRPYCIGYKAEEIINWRTERRKGQKVLTRVVLRETHEVPDPKDEFVNLIQIRYRVVQLVGDVCQVQLWKEKANKEYEIDGSPVTLMRRGEPLDFVPFVFICASNATPDLEIPPLIDLADINLGHWRNSVDHEYGLHLVALPTPWVAGAKSSGDATAPLPIGPSKVWELDVQGSAGMLEFSGEGLGALVSAMDEKKKQMATLGARLLEDSAVVQETASAVGMRHSSEHASIRTVAQSIELGFTLVLQIVAWWAGTDKLPQDTDVNVELNKEYLNIKASAQDVQAALTALQADEISFKTWWGILQGGGWAPPDVDAEAEQKEIQKKKDKDAADAKKNQPELPPTLVKKIVRDPNTNLVTEIHG